jgi:RNA polymerase sigma-70 factor (ECF subfamily)
MLQRALRRLDQADREVLVLRDLEELGGDETARLLGLSVGAMKSRLHRARLRLAAQLREGRHARA